MSATCPHCHRPTIALRRKLYAVDAYPAQCPVCGGLSYVGANIWYMLLLCVPELIGIVLLAAWSTNLFLGALGILVLLGVFVAYHRLAPMVTITAKRVRFSRWWYAIGWLAILGLIAWVALQSPNDAL